MDSQHPNPSVQVALSKTFMRSMGNLDSDDAKRAVNRFAMALTQAPTSPEFNYEPVPDAFDPNLRQVRIDRALRAIVFRPEGGNAYVLLHVGPQAEVLAWARRRSCKVHPDTGTLQVFVVEEDDAQHIASAAEIAAQTTPEADAPGSAPPAPDAPAPEAGDAPEATDAPAPEATDAPEAADAPDDDAPLADLDRPYPGLFGAYSGAALRKLGVPVDLMYLVRHFKDRDEFDQNAWKLPSAAEEALVQLLDGATYRAVLTDIHGPRVLDTPDPVNVEDYAGALRTDAARAEFTVAEDEEALAKMLDEPLALWRTYLHRSQRRLVERDYSGPARVLGGAGTGKTVVAMHRAVKLARDIFNRPNDRILFTTFTRNLAADIQANLRQLCGPELMRRVEVVHLDGWVSAFLKRQGFGRQIKYFSNSRDPRLRALWAEAMLQRDDTLALPLTFYREEWEQVVQAQGITRARDYYRAARVGRGVRLGRKQRHLIWRVFEEYQNLMADHGVCEREDALRAARHLLEAKGDILPYRAVLVDEAQDMSNEAFKLIRQLVPEGDEGRPNDLFIVGDGHQRIYNHRVALSRCGVRIVGRAYRLKINYRTTAEIQRFAVSVLEGLEVDDLDGGQDALAGYRSLVQGAAPEVRVCATFAEELEAIVAFLGRGALNDTCLVTRTHEQLERYSKALAAQGVEVYPLSRRAAEDASAPGVRLATMHRVKGLEFDRVILAGVNAGVVPLQEAIDDTQDDAVREARELQERALFYVACSRAKRAVLVTAFGEPSPFLGRAGA